ncbi:transporter substrate-binding domain-containing protein [Aurantimonas endophytica]|uniref:Polar amino acid transport system substrate-binding protein n=1 Tax=Aurantimonas endophytica TaxID=1522175 RepID=A0A7W6HEC4_9HYPH|nr:transporter substrate-binding domain-containing protein [Aurantimonas endophytica]MBB4003651.1 polar amino acid transport system substrate-binding protein [Aurantimonas endophytica]MCO6404509.1 transporter substrate-binding domain-containing protein [Aurantimonas endophytica]
MSFISRKFFAVIAGAAVLASALSPNLASAETTLEKIKRTGKVTVGTEAAFPPFEFVEDGKIVGYGSDILAEVVKALDVEVEQLDVPWQGILPGVLAGKFDFVATTVGINEERAARYAYTLPIANGEPYAMKRVGDDLASAEDLEGKVVGTQLASSTEPVARDFDAKLKEAGGEGFSELKLYTAFTESYVALANGEIDAVIQSLPNLAVLVKQRPETFELVGPVQAGSAYTYLAWVTRPEDTDLRDFISGVIREMRDDGRLGELQDKWFGFRMDIPDTGYLPPDAL